MINNCVSLQFNKSIFNKNTNNNDLSFKSRPIFQVNVKKMADDNTYKTVPALFSEMVKGDKKDEKQFLKILGMWKNTTYCKYIYDNYKKNDDSIKIYLVELLENNPLYKKTVSLMSTRKDCSKKGDLYMSLELLEVRPDLRYGNKSREIKGAGELGMYGLSKLASLDNAKSLNFEVTSQSYKFYDGINISEGFERYRFMDKAKIEEFVGDVEKKYDFTPINK